MTTLTAPSSPRLSARFVGRIAFTAVVALRRFRRLARARVASQRLQHLPDHLLVDFGLIRSDLRNATIWGRSRL